VKNGRYYAKVFFIAIGAFIVLDHGTASNSLLSTATSGAVNFTKAAQGR
jgi:hypothetical protein